MRLCDLNINFIHTVIFGGGGTTKENFYTWVAVWSLFQSPFISERGFKLFSFLNFILLEIMNPNINPNS